MITYVTNKYVIYICISKPLTPLVERIHPAMRVLGCGHATEPSHGLEDLAVEVSRNPQGSEGFSWSYRMIFRLHLQDSSG